ncbi:MAG: TPM domain-containing protein [Hyphomicrobiales bacterium]
MRLIAFPIIALLFSIVITTIPAKALLVPERPAIGEFIADTVDMISIADKIEIQQTAQRLQDEYKIPIIVATIDSLLTYTDGEYLGIEKYSRVLFKHWGIGHKAHNYGILLLISENDKIARIQFGSGWGFLYDDHAQAIMDKTIIPHFKNGAFSEGIKQGVISLDKLARTDLKFLINQQKIILSVLVLMLIAGSLFSLMIIAIGERENHTTKVCAGGVGGLSLGLLTIYWFGGFNHIEFLITLAIYIAIKLIGIAIYGYVHAQTHRGIDTLKATGLLLLFVIIVPIAVIFTILAVFGQRGEYGGGDADYGGGATGSWD